MARKLHVISDGTNSTKNIPLSKNQSGLKIEYLSIRKLMPATKTPRAHPDSQVYEIKSSMQMFGFTNPLLIDEGDNIIAGHGRHAAAMLLGLVTVPCIRLIADAIRDCSHHNGIILDAFAGSGTTILAAEQTGRRAYCVELDPLYVDVTIRRWQDLTRKSAMHAETGLSFDDMAKIRSEEEVVNVAEANKYSSDDEGDA